MHRVALFTFALAFAAVTWAADPFVGTWKLNSEKSKLTGGPPREPRPPRVIEAEGANLRFDDFTFYLDGTERAQGNLLQTNRRLDPRRLISVGRDKESGSVVFEALRFGSHDGRTMTMTSYTTNKAGERFHNLFVYERQ